MEKRLVELIDAEQLTSAKFADAIGVQRSSISHILSGRNKPSYDFLQKTLTAFPYINADWLITGDGEMYKGDMSAGSLFKPEQHDLNKNTGNDNVTSEIAGPETDASPNKSSQQVISNPGELQIQPGELKIKKVILIYADDTFQSYEPKA